MVLKPAIAAVKGAFKPITELPSNLPDYYAPHPGPWKLVRHRPQPWMSWHQPWAYLEPTHPQPTTTFK